MDRISLRNAALAADAFACLKIDANVSQSRRYGSTMTVILSQTRLFASGSTHVRHEFRIQAA